MSHDAKTALAHQRATVAFSTPALTCHLAFRPRPDIDPINAKEPGEIQKRKSAWVGRINSLLDHFAQQRLGHPNACRFAETTPSTSDNPQQIVDQHDSLHITLANFGPFQIRLTVSIFIEYASLSFSAFPLRHEPSNDPQLSHELADAERALNALDEVIAKKINNYAEADNTITKLFEQFWTSFFRAVNASSLVEPVSAGNNSQPRLLGERFGWFVGIVLRAPQPGEAESHSLASEVARNALAREPKLAFPHENIVAIHDDKEFNSLRQITTAFLDARRNFFARLLGFHHHYKTDEIRAQRYRAGNAVLCSMQRGAALYGSTLGGVASLPYGPASVRYFIVYAGPSRGQLGRLVSRLHNSGELRLAALFDHEELWYVSDLIRSVDLRMGQLERHGQRAPRTDTAELQNDLRQIATLVTGGLAFRTSRSRHYASALRDRIAALNIHTEYGWQDYGAFIRRTLNHHFENLSEIGQRYERLVERLQSLDYFLIANTVAHDQRESRRLLTYAEIFAVAASVYYGGSVLATIAETNTGVQWIEAFCSATAPFLDCRGPDQNLEGQEQWRTSLKAVLYITLSSLGGLLLLRHFPLSLGRAIIRSGKSQAARRIQDMK